MKTKVISVMRELLIGKKNRVILEQLRIGEWVVVMEVMVKG